MLSTLVYYDVVASSVGSKVGNFFMSVVQFAGHVTKSEQIELGRGGPATSLVLSGHLFMVRPPLIWPR